ncbi:MAG: TonB family protein [Tannerella sp.]|jgi:protein TonB|nr:TonB family protein [Tannerella sp.]
MGKDINLYSQSWNDIIFEDKNKTYGAYELRQTSGKRHLIAVIGSLLIAAFVAALPTLIDTVKSLRPPVENISDASVLADLAEVEEQEKLDDIVEQTETPPPPMKSTMQFIEPIIASAEEIKEDETLKTQDELQESKIQISTQTVEGTDEEHGIDIADLEVHTKVADDTDTKIFEVVEQNPEFPGGNVLKWVSEHISYPVVAQENGIKGTVTLKFVVTRDGSVGQIQIVRGVDASLDKEAVRVVQAMPKWIPGKQNGKNVNVWFTLPIKFQLNQ